MRLGSMLPVEPAALTRRRVAQLATVLLVVLAACGPDPGPSPIFTASATATGLQPTPGPGVPGAGSNPFVGSASCPTDGAQPYSPSPPLANASPVIGQVIPEMPHFHVSAGTPVDYDHNPPTSGCHWSSDGAPASPGVYDQPVPPEAWVHNLEHGYIVVLYDCPSGCPAVVTALEKWLTTLPPDPAGQGLIPYAKLLVTPYHGMPTPFAVLSWDYYLPLAAFDIGQVEAFYANHVGRSPEGPLSA
jgi:hypothetical protein